MADKLQKFVGTQEWFDKPDLQQKALNAEFSLTVAKSPEYIAADDVGKAKLQQAYQRVAENTAFNSEYNPSNIRQRQNQATAEYGGVLDNTVAKIKQSLEEGAVRTTAVTDDLLFGRNKYSAEDLSRAILKRREQAMTFEQKQLAADYSKFEKKLAQEGVLNDTAAVAGLVWDVVTNPGAVLQTAAESSSSMAAMGGGAKVGGLAGPFGAIAGMFTAGAIDAGTHKLLSEVENGLADMGVDPTPANIKMFLDNNPKALDAARAKAAKYGTVLGAVDALTGGIVGKIATLPTRAARQAAIRSIGGAERIALKEAATQVAKDTGRSVKAVTEELTEQAINIGTKGNLKNISFKNKLGYKAAGVAGETASEPLSEAAATAAVGDEVKGEDLFYETIGGLGSGPIMTAVDVGATGTKIGKTGTTKAAAFAKKIATATPEERAATKVAKAETKAANKLKTAQVDQADFNKEVESVTDVEDQRITEWTSPDNKETYNPIKAVAALANVGTPDAMAKAKDVIYAIDDQVDTLDAELAEYQAKGAENLTPHEIDIIKQKTKQIDALGETTERAFKIIDPIIKKQRAEKQATPAPAVDVETASTEEIESTIDNSFGSHQQNVEQLQKIIDSDKTSPEYKKVAEALKTEANVKENFYKTVTGNKSTEQVQNDVYYGDEKKNIMGILNHQQAIQEAVRSKSEKRSNTALSLLKSFRDSQIGKLEVMTAALNEAKSTGKEVKVKYKNESYILYPTGKSDKLVSNVQAEVNSLNAAVNTSETLLQANKIKVTSPITPFEQEQTNGDTQRNETGTQERDRTKEQDRKVQQGQQEKVTTARLEKLVDKIIAGVREEDLSKEDDRLLVTHAKEIEAIKAKRNKNVTPESIKAEALAARAKTKAEMEAANAKVAAESKPTKPEIVEQTVVEETQPDNVSELDNDPDMMEVTVKDRDGKEISGAYRELADNIQTQIEECESILNCIKG